ncbi:MAG TPA: hypothetical protein VGM98_24730, partial [Schlesneria sp.]
DGFVGLAQASTVDSLSDTDHVVNAGGTTVDGASSVWLVRSSDDDTGVTVIMGKDGQIEIGDYVTIKNTDGSGKSYPAYYTPMCGWLGLQVGSAYDIVRIANITQEDGHTLDDDLLSMALELFPSGKQPTHIAMHRKVRGQLQRSRSTFNNDGKPAPMPTDYEGIPIICTDQLNAFTEALLT